MFRRTDHILTSRIGSLSRNDAILKRVWALNSGLPSNFLRRLS